MGRTPIGSSRLAIAAGLRKRVVNSVLSVCWLRSRLTASRASSIARSICGSITASAPSCCASATRASVVACCFCTSAMTPAIREMTSSTATPASTPRSLRAARPAALLACPDELPFDRAQLIRC